MKKIIFTILVVMCSMTSMQMSYATSKAHATKSHISSQQVVNINTADETTLSTLKGIGAKKAQAIINYREKNGNFKSVDDLASVKGIGKKGLARIEKNNPGRMSLAQ